MMNQNQQTYSLEELAGLTGLSPRTIRSYIQKGLLPGAETRGRNASYTAAHLDRLRCLQVLRDSSGLSLDELRMVMQSLAEDQIHRIAVGEEDVIALPVGQAVPPRQSDDIEPLYSIENKFSAPARSCQAADRSSEGRDSSSALEYIRRIRNRDGPDESRFAELIRTLEQLVGDRRVYRKARNEWWATVKVTEDMEIRVRGLEEKDVGRLERLADLLRYLLMQGGRK
jgi:DNA-binding transcriptional MerR regulator